MRIVVTGCNGFVGSNLIQKLDASGHSVVSVERKDIEDFSMSGTEAIIHCAGIAHRNGANRESYQEANHRLPVRIAKRAAAAGVLRFVFVSTINVVAGHKETILDHRLSYAPTNEYGQSKADAETTLLEISDLDIVIARPCLIYGKKAPGSIRQLAKLAATSLPLPFGAASNSRSFLSISNCVAALEFLVTTHRDKVAGRTFHLADPRPTSTAELVSQLRRVTGRSPGLVSVPVPIMKALLAMIGKTSLSEQLFGDLLVNSTALTEAGFVFSDDGLLDMRALAQSLTLP